MEAGDATQSLHSVRGAGAVPPEGGLGAHHQRPYLDSWCQCFKELGGGQCAQRLVEPHPHWLVDAGLGQAPKVLMEWRQARHDASRSNDFVRVGVEDK